MNAIQILPHNACGLQGALQTDTEASTNRRLMPGNGTNSSRYSPLHEDIEDKCLCGSIFEAVGHSTPLGDWEVRHDTDVATVQRLIQATKQFDPASPNRPTSSSSPHIKPEWS